MSLLYYATNPLTSNKFINKQQLHSITTTSHTAQPAAMNGCSNWFDPHTVIVIKELHRLIMFLSY